MAKGIDEPEKKDATLAEYVWALQILDSGDGLGDIIGDILTANAGDIDAALSQMGEVLSRLRDIMGLRGWKPTAGAMQLMFRAKVSGWQPRVTPEASILRLNLDISYPAPDALPILWEALGKTHDVIMRGTVRQPALGEAPPEWDIETVIEGHESGAHRVLPEMECPMCLAALAAKQLQSGPVEDVAPEPEGDDQGEPAGED